MRSKIITLDYWISRGIDQ